MGKNNDNLDELRSVAELQTELTRIKRENKAAFKTIDKLIADNKKKEEEISHLKSLLEKSVPVLIEDQKPQQVIRIELEPEEEIAELQLQKLREAARKRSLTLEETRQYDLLVKNKRLSKEQSTINLDNNQYKNMDDKKLMEIAGTVDGKRTTKKRSKS